MDERHNGDKKKADPEEPSRESGRLADGEAERRSRSSEVTLTASDERREWTARVLRRSEMFEALAHRRRRRLLCAFYEHTDWGLTELARWIAAEERGVPVSAVEESVVERVALSLYHTHVPLLVESGLVTFDDEAERVGATATTGRLLDALADLGESCRRGGPG